MLNKSLKLKNLLGTLFFTFAYFCGLYLIAIPFFYAYAYISDNRPFCSELSTQTIMESKSSFAHLIYLGIASSLVIGGLMTLIVIIINLIQERQKANNKYDYEDNETVVIVIGFVSLSLLMIAYWYWDLGTGNFLICDTLFTLTTSDYMELVKAFFYFIFGIIFPTGSLGTCAWVFWEKILRLNSEISDEYD